MSRRTQHGRSVEPVPPTTAGAARPLAAAADPRAPEAQAQQQAPEQGAAPAGGHSFSAAPARLEGGRMLQPKLRLGAPDDPHEDEADRVAEQVTRGVAAPEERPTIRRAPTTAGTPALAPETAAAVESLSGGQPLAPATRDTLEARIGHDFSQVRVHTGPRAAALAEQLQARAFTIGRDVAFAPGQYQPGTPAGQRLLAHELAHVAQQGQAVVRRGDDDATTAVVAEKQIQTGSTGDSVKEAQELLNKHGAAPPLKVDGIFGPKTAAATRAFQIRRNLVPDGIIGPYTWKALRATPLAAGATTNFDKVSGGVATKDAPDEFELPEAVVKGMQKAWDKSLPGGKSQEQGGIIVKNKDNSYGWKAGKAGDSGSFSPNYGDKGADETLVGSGHTHPYDKSEGGFTDVSFSGQDIARLVYVEDPISVVQSGDMLFTIIRTTEFDARVKKLDAAGKKKLFDEITKAWNDTYKATKGKVPERAEAATKATCSKYGLSYYKGKQGVMKKQ